MRLYPTLLLSLTVGAILWDQSILLSILAFIGVWVVAFLIAAKADRL